VSARGLPPHRFLKKILRKISKLVSAFFRRFRLLEEPADDADLDGAGPGFP
jgi:hypothetical protein